MPSLVDVEEWGDYSKVAAPENAATLLAAASGAIRDYCRWYISLQEVEDEEMDGRGGPLLVLPTLQLVSVESITLVDEADVETDLVENTDYRWSRRGVIRRKPNGLCWPREYRAVKISYTHGYAEVPPEIKALCVGMVRRLDSVPAGVIQKSVGGVTLQYGADTGAVALTKPEEYVLDYYALESAP